MRLFALALILGLSPTVAASPSSVTDAQRAIQAIYARQDAAYAHKNVAGALYGCAPDFREVHTEPKVHGMSFTITQLRPMIQSTLVLSRRASRRTTIRKITLNPTGAVTIIGQHLSAYMWNPKAGKYGKLLTDSVASDTWVKGKGGWQEKQSVVLSGRTKVFIHPLPAHNRKAVPVN